MDFFDGILIILGFIVLISYLLAPIVLIVGLVEVCVARRPRYSDPDRRIYFARNHSIGYRFMVRLLTFGACITLPELVGMILTSYKVHESVIVLSVILTVITGLLFFGLSFLIKLTYKVDRIVVDRTGMTVFYRKKKIPNTYYSLDYFRGYDKKYNLQFADRSGSSFYVNTKYLGKKYSIALGNDLLALSTGREICARPDTHRVERSYVSDYPKTKEDIKKETKVETPNVEKIVKPAVAAMPLQDSSSILADYGPLKTDTSSSILGEYGPLKNNDSLGLLNDSKPFAPEDTLGLISGTEEHIQEAAKGTLEEHEPAKETEEEEKEPVVTKPSNNGDLPDISSLNNRIFIKNSYLTDIDKKTVSFNSSRPDEEKIDTSSSHYPGSSWMYVDVKGNRNIDILDLFISCMKLTVDLSDLNKDIFFYAEGSDASSFVAYIRGNDMVIQKAGKSYIYDADNLKLVPEQEDSSSGSDIKEFIKRKFYLDV